MNKTYILAILIILTTSVFLASCVGSDTEFSWYEESETYSNESASSSVSGGSEIASEESEEEFVSEMSFEEKVSLPFVPFE